MFVTFIACLLLRIDLGILIGIVVNMCYILYNAARPKIYMEEKITPSGKKYFLIIPDRCIIFPSADYVRTIINKQSMYTRTPIVLDCTHCYTADYTSAKAIGSMLKDFKDRKQCLYFLNLKSSIAKVLRGAKLEFHLHYNFETLESEIDETCVGSPYLEIIK